jgi:hypothetical protein
MFLGFTFMLFLYTDPGTGTLILQLLIAAFLGVFFYIRFFFKRVGGFFSKKKRANDSQVYDEAPGELPETSFRQTENASQVNLTI